MVLVGVLLSAGLLLVAVEAVGYQRGSYNAAFWKLPLDEKLDHLSRHRWEWWWISIWELVSLFLMTGGIFGLVYLLADSGEPVLAYVALGWYLVALFAWVFGLLVQGASMSQASRQRTETGVTPSWIHPFWEAGYLAEVAWIVGANLSYAIIGLALLQTTLIADWAGWVSLIGGGIIAVLVLLTRTGFPQLAILIPAAIGIALLIEAT